MKIIKCIAQIIPWTSISTVAFCACYIRKDFTKFDITRLAVTHNKKNAKLESWCAHSYAQPTPDREFFMKMLSTALRTRIQSM